MANSETFVEPAGAMSYSHAIQQKFAAAFDRDRDRYVKNWMVTWECQDRRRSANLRYDSGLPQNFDSYGGASGLIQWFNWGASTPLPDYFDDARLKPLVDLSASRDGEILAANNLTFDMSHYRRTIGRYNAQDYSFQNFYPVPERQSIRRILDFGAGYGRQANLWTQMCPEVSYVGVDAVPLSYCLQNLYYGHMGLPFSEYVDDPNAFKITEGRGIYHLPTWRTDLLPPAFFDMVICVQVLPELNGKLVRFLIDLFQTILKPGGCLYIRDHDLAWQPAHKMDLSRLLRRRGFDLEFRPHVVDRSDVHGIPRIWRKLDPEVQAARKQDQSGLKRLIARSDARLGGFGKKVYRLVKGRKT